MKKKAQQTVTAGGLVSIIAGLIILYIMFIPQDVRDELLDRPSSGGGGTVTPGGGGSSTGDIEVILKASPGRISYAATDEFEYDIQPFTLFASTVLYALCRLGFWADCHEIQ